MSEKSYPDYEAAKAEVKMIQGRALHLNIINMDSPAEVKKRGGARPSIVKKKPKPTKKPK